MIVLDTHALVWWVSEPARLGARARRAINAAVDAREPIAVSSISAWEISVLASVGRLKLRMDVAAWLAQVESLPFFNFVPVDNRIAVRSANLEGFPHRDPADRIIVATALSFGATLVTADERIRAYRPLKTTWA